jgi:hypothetical protein
MMAQARKQPNQSGTAGIAPQSSGRHDPEDGAGVVITLADLVQDSNGEVVLFNDSGLRSLGLATNAAVIQEGQLARHVTAAGEDVSGFRFILFEGGLKLLFPPELDLILMRDRPEAR